MFEQKLEDLLKDRKEINNCDDFDKITTLWTKIKSNYTECKSYIDNINKEINELMQIDNEEILKESKNIKFGDAFKEMKEITEKIKLCKFSELSQYLKRIKLLKLTCLSILKQEKHKIQEVG